MGVVAVKNLFLTTAVIAGLAICAPVFAQGYKGVMSGSSNDGYGTVMPPSEKTETGKGPKGYRGVIPGETLNETPAADPALPDEEVEDQVKAPPAQQTRPAPVAKQLRMSTERQRPRQTYVPGQGPRTPMLTAEQLKLISTLSGMKIDLKKLPENMRESIKINPKVYSLVSSPATRIDGMLPTEFGAKKMIDTNMYIIDQSNFTPEKKKEAYIDLMIRLRQMADGLRMRQSVPNELYAQMGVPAIYVQEEKEGTAKGIARLDQAIKYIYELQKQL
jgi:hypothetical protein